MTKYKCKKCKNTISISKHTIIVVKDKTVCKEAYCRKCDLYMKDISEYNGFGVALMRNGKTLRSSKNRNAQPSGKIGDENS